MGNAVCHPCAIETDRPLLHCRRDWLDELEESRAICLGAATGNLRPGSLPHSQLPRSARCTAPSQRGAAAGRRTEAADGKADNSHNVIAYPLLHTNSVPFSFPPQHSLVLSMSLPPAHVFPNFGQPSHGEGRRPHQDSSPHAPFLSPYSSGWGVQTEWQHVHDSDQSTAPRTVPSTDIATTAFSPLPANQVSTSSMPSHNGFISDLDMGVAFPTALMPALTPSLSIEPIPAPLGSGASNRAQQAPRPRRSKWQGLDWDRQRETIRQLYMVEEKSLKDTMEIMAQKHNFHASSVSFMSYRVCCPRPMLTESSQREVI